MAKGDRAYSKPEGIKMCDCECSRYMHCPIGEDAPKVFQECKEQYKATLKAMKGDV